LEGIKSNVTFVLSRVNPARMADSVMEGHGVCRNRDSTRRGVWAGCALYPLLCVRDGVDVGAHHAHLIVLLAQIVQQDVTQGHHADQMSIQADGHVTEAVPPH
jgi:hypothetical protein